MSQTLTLPVRPPIKLGQALKLSGIVEDGATAAVAISCGDVAVNGEVEKRRGRRLDVGDTVTVALPSGPITIAISDR